jgi:cell division protein FtsW (lipid II flippase)
VAGTPANTRLSRLAAPRQAVRLLILACPAWLAGFLVLHLAGASTSLMRQQALAIGAACLLAGCGSVLAARFSRLSIAAGVAVATIVGLALPLGAATSGPHRWLAIGRLQLYVAPLLLPACVSAWTVLAARHGRVAWLIHLSATALLLAAQPDASQALALLLALAAGVARVRPIRTPLLLVLGFVATCTVLASSGRIRSSPSRTSKVSSPSPPVAPWPRV